MLSFFEVPKGVLEKLDYYRSGFFWQSDDHRKKYRLAKWSILCQPKERGGLGIKNLELQSRCLLNKWLYKLINQGHLAKFIKKQVPKELDHCSGAKESRGLSLLGSARESKRYFYKLWNLSIK